MVINTFAINHLLTYLSIALTGVFMSNPLSKYYRSPKLFTRLPSRGQFYDDTVIDMPENGELAIHAMTAKDEMIMKNPDALLNGEAVARVIASCVPAVKQPRALVSNDIDALLIAIQGATAGDDIEVSTKCPSCNEEVGGIASIESALDGMTILEETYKFETDQGLTVEVRPFTYESTVKAGITNFQSTRSLQSIQNITDEMEQLKAFNESFMQIAALNFDLIVDSVASVRGTDDDNEAFVVTNRETIREFLENCEASIGRTIENSISEVNKIGVQRKIMLECEACENQFEHEVGFDPVNFFTAS
jgi:hypothetical protein